MAEAETGTSASRILYINSEDARKQGGNLTHSGTSFTTTNYRFILQQPITVPAHHSIVMSLHHASIPYTFYNFRRNINDKLRFSITASGVNGSTAVEHTIFITPGNYTALSMIAEIQKKLEAHASFDGKLHIRFNPETNKYEWRYNIAAGHPHGHRLTLRFTQDPDTFSEYTDDIHSEIGFDNMKWFELSGLMADCWFDDNGSGAADAFTFGWSLGGAAAGQATIDTSDSTSYYFTGDDKSGPPLPYINYFSSIDMSAHNHSLYVRTNLSSHSVQDSGTGGAFSSILAKIPVQGERGSIITLDPTDGAVHQLLLKVKVIDAIFIRLTDRQNRFIDLNGLDWNIALQLDFIETPKLEIPIDKRLEIEQKLYNDFKKSKEETK
jgi:hypothetical protein